MTEKQGSRIAPLFAEGLGAGIRRLCAGRERVRRRFSKVNHAACVVKMAVGQPNGGQLEAFVLDLLQ